MFCYQSFVLSRHSEILLFKMVGENSFPDDDDDFRRIELPETDIQSCLQDGDFPAHPLLLVHFIF